MKKIFTMKHPFLFSLIFLSIFFSQNTTAQTLEEIPNPTGNTLNWFSGGENSNLFFRYFAPDFNTDLFYYDGTDLHLVPLVNDDFGAFYSNSYNDNFYITTTDLNFNQVLVEYDGTTVTVLPLPAGFQFGGFLDVFDSKMYLFLYDTNFNISVYSYDGTSLTELANPAGLTFGSYISTYNNLMYFNFNDANFNSTIFSFDGTTFTEITGPTDVEYSFFIGQTEDQMYLSFFEPSTFVSILYLFDGTTFTEIANPTGFEFSWVSFLGEDASYLNYDDTNFNTSIFKLEGTALTEVPIPTGFQFPNYVHRFDGRDFFSLYDLNFNQFLFGYDGTDFIEVDAPTGFNFSQYLDTIQGKAYYLYFDNNFNSTFESLSEGSNSVMEVASPTGFTYNNYVTSSNEKLFISLYDNIAFIPRLFIFDGAEFIEVGNPAGRQYDAFMIQDDGYLYLRYVDNNFDGTLYKLRPNSIPTSADNSVTTFINIPYFFESNDFSFTDTDNNDSLSAILITEVETVGNLFYDGAHVYVGDIIPAADLGKLVFFPNTDDEALNYDYFKFKVFDGDAFSEEDYTMNINVADEATSTDNNFLNANILLFPVPADPFTTLQINATQPIKSLNVRIIAMNGQVVYQELFNQIGTEFQHQFDLSAVASGQYILHGIAPNGMVAKTIIKK